LHDAVDGKEEHERPETVRDPKDEIARDRDRDACEQE
jgi:hypothetical protein